MATGNVLWTEKVLFAVAIIDQHLQIQGKSVGRFRAGYVRGLGHGSSILDFIAARGRMWQADEMNLMHYFNRIIGNIAGAFQVTSEAFCLLASSISQETSALVISVSVLGLLTRCFFRFWLGPTLISITTTAFNISGPVILEQMMRKLHFN